LQSFWAVEKIHTPTSSNQGDFFWEFSELPCKKKKEKNLVLTSHPAPFPLQVASLVAAQLLAFCSAPFSVFLCNSTVRIATFIDRIYPAPSSLLAAAPVAAPLLAFCSAPFSIILLDSTLASTAA